MVLTIMPIIHLSLPALEGWQKDWASVSGTIALRDCLHIRRLFVSLFVFFIPTVKLLFLLNTTRQHSEHALQFCERFVFLIVVFEIFLHGCNTV